MLLKLLNAILVGILHVERRFEPFFRHYLDAIFREPAASLLQFLINRKRQDERLKIAEEMERGLKAYGHVVMRVNIDPNTFSNWCAAHGTSPSREGRKRFLAAAVFERYGDQD